MEVRILGASGGATNHLKTTSLLIDGDILVDAGTGVDELTLEEMQRVRHVFLTHSHLDHVVGIPLICDMVFERRARPPIVVHAREETLAALRAHIFNWVMWPDFGMLPSSEQPLVRYAPMRPGEHREIEGRHLEMIGVNHAVPAVGYRVDCPTGAFAFSGDTTTNDGFWDALNRHPELDLLFVESAFADEDADLSRMARHYTPRLLAQDLGKLRHRPEVYITHLKPGAESAILDQCRAAITHLPVRPLCGGEVFRL
ncbi:MAG: 3',5'-cyclic-nucleotide phosphodiesterase [Gammaproteobacteria bacterium]|nr:3',5'-cyclic-nucleotide phosphodiesterase [Gammaproteobacteria bacterium]